MNRKFVVIKTLIYSLILLTTTSGDECNEIIKPYIESMTYTMCSASQGITQIINCGYKVNKVSSSLISYSEICDFEEGKGFEKMDDIQIYPSIDSIKITPFVKKSTEYSCPNFVVNSYLVELECKSTRCVKYSSLMNEKLIVKMYSTNSIIENSQSIAEGLISLIKKHCSFIGVK